MERKVEQAKSFEQLKGDVVSVLEDMHCKVEREWLGRSGFASYETAEFVEKLRESRFEPFVDIVTKIIAFLQNPPERIEGKDVRTKFRSFKEEVLAVQKPRAEADVTAGLDPLLGTIVSSMMGPIARGVQECLTHMNLGSAAERTRLLAARDLEKKLRAAEERLAKVAELESTLRRVRGERNILREKVGELTKRLEAMTGAKDFVDAKCRELRARVISFSDEVSRLLSENQRLEADLKRKGGRGGDTDVVSCVKVEEGVFKNPLSILGVSAAEVTQAYSEHRDEDGFKKKLGKIFYPRIHTDKYEFIVKKLKELGDTQIPKVFVKFFESRLKRVNKASDEIWQQLSRTGSLKAEWVREE